MSRYFLVHLKRYLNLIEDRFIARVFLQEPLYHLVELSSDKCGLVNVFLQVQQINYVEDSIVVKIQNLKCGPCMSLSLLIVRVWLKTFEKPVH